MLAFELNKNPFISYYNREHLWSFIFFAAPPAANKLPNMCCYEMKMAFDISYPAQWYMSHVCANSIMIIMTANEFLTALGPS